VGDDVAEGQEHFTFALSEPSAGAKAVSGTVTILADDGGQAPLTLLVSDSHATESAGTIDFVLRLSAPQASAVSGFYSAIEAGSTASAEHGSIAWKRGDLFVLPATRGALSHAAASDCGADGAALYAISDEPLLRYLGVTASEPRFGAAFYSREVMEAAVEAVRHEPGAEHRNRMGVLLSNEGVLETKTLSPVLWALLNVLPARTKQPPHRHQSVAVDLCVSVAAGAEGLVYTMMGPELDEAGWVKNPIKMDWASGAVFTTPPGWWHSHHNESGADAWVLPTQDAGLYTHQRTLDIRFSHAKPEPAGSGGR